MIQDVTKLSKFFYDVEDCVLLAPGEELFHEGDSGNQMFLLKYGEADIRINGKLVGQCGAGNTLGEECLIENAFRLATVTAASECKLIVVNRERLIALASKTPIVINRLKRLITVRRLIWTP